MTKPTVEPPWSKGCSGVGVGETLRLAIVAFLLTGLVGLLGGCASLALYDPGLAKQADAIDTNVQSGLSLSAYDDRIAKLKALATEEDKTDADLGVAERNLSVAKILENDVVGPKNGGASPRAAALASAASDRLQDLTGARQEPDVGHIRLLTYYTIQAAQLTTVVDSDRFRYELETPAKARLARHDCDSLKTAATITDNGDAAGLQTDCLALRDAQNKANSELKALVGTSANSLLATTYAASQAASKPADVAPANLDQLNAAIAAAKDAAGKGNAKDLSNFEDGVSRALTGLSAAAKAVGWAKAKTDLDAVAESFVCNDAPAGDPTCSAVKATSTTGRAMAVMALAQALAQASDVNRPGVQSARWLAAASAIAAAHEQDAKLQTDAEKATQTAADQRLDLMLVELQLLGRTLDALNNPNCGAQAWACAMPSYVQSWNAGRIPEGVLANRGPQATRLSLINRQRAAAEAQQTLIRSADAALKAYAESGTVQAAPVAQLIYALALIGVAASK